MQVIRRSWLEQPARVGRVAKADILAYLLRMNRFPAGKTEMQSKAEMLKDILIEPTRESGGKQ